LPIRASWWPSTARRSPPACALLKDRLYIGYQEQSAVIEIISYNEAAGRFEFQLLKDYRAGSKPRLIYANRSICFACHQNGSPIFSRALWDETNANAKVAATLLASGRSFYGISPDRGVDVPYAIDNASERANGFALTQLLWRAGCGGNSAAAQGCRAGLFAAALRHALSGGQTWTPDARFMQAVDKRLREQARRRWPGGLSAGNPDIPNRNPLQAVDSWPADSAARAAVAAVPARFDPLLPRPAGALWRPDAADALRQLLAGLAEFVADSDRRQLDSALARLAPAVTERLSVPCRIDSKVASRWSLRCTAAGGSLLAGTLSMQAGKPSGGRLARLTLPAGTALNGVDLTLLDEATPSGATLLPQVGGLPARTAAGSAIGSIGIRRNAGGGVGVDGADGEVTLEIRHDFSVVQQAIDRLAAGRDAANLFGPMPFPRERLFAALFAELGMPATPACCAAAEHLPPAQLEVAAVAPGQTPSSAGDPTAAQPFSPTAPPATRPPRLSRRISCTAVAAEVECQAAPLRAAPLRSPGDGRRCAGTACQDADAAGKHVAGFCQRSLKHGAAVRCAPALLAQVDAMAARRNRSVAATRNAARQRLRGAAPVPAGALRIRAKGDTA
jgi:hypothetical protein